MRNTKTGNVSIRAAFNISGSAADSAVDGTTYRALFLQGIEESWSNSTTSAYARESSKGISANIVDGAGVSNVNYGVFLGIGWWSKSNLGKMTIYTSFSSGTLRTSDEFKYTVAHEFGHSLGIGDAYLDKYSPNAATPNDMMRWNNGVTPVVSQLNIEMLLRAWKTGKFQNFTKIK